MKFVKILNYVEPSFEGRPSFVILMSDGKEYISNGCVFIEKTQENIDKLIEDHDCEKYLDELFEAPGIDISELTDGRNMFRGCESLTEFNHDISSLKYGCYMFLGCKELTEVTRDMPNLENGQYMFATCNSLGEFTSGTPNLKICDMMFIGCKKTNWR